MVWSFVKITAIRQVMLRTRSQIIYHNMSLNCLKLEYNCAFVVLTPEAKLN